MMYAQDEKILRWGMDATGGAPYVFDNNTKGFEVEIAQYIADHMGRTPQEVNGEWNKLPASLNRGDLDIVLNGYEFAPQFREQASIPYYIYRLRAVVRANDTSIQTWEDLRSKPGEKKKRIGVLTGSAAYRYMDQVYGDSIDLQQYDDVANTFQLVANDTLDATVQDSPAAIYYVNDDAEKKKQLRALAEPRAEGFYIILTRTDDKTMRAAVNAALRNGIEDGSFERIFKKYNIWNTDQQRLNYYKNKSWVETEASSEEMIATPPIDWGKAIGDLLLAARMTVFLAIVAMPIASIIGLIVAVLRLYGPRGLNAILSLYVEVLRGTPFLLQLWVLFYVLPELSSVFKRFPPEFIGILGLALNYSASQAEHFRGAFQNLARGQLEAALSLGMTRIQAIRIILAPQAIRAAVPSMTNDFVAMFKDTAICSVIAVMELTKQYNTLYNNYREHMFALAAITALLYMCMSYPLAIASRQIERRLSRSGEHGRI